MDDTGGKTAAIPGTNSDSPWRMPASAWKDVLVRTWTQAGEDNVSLAAAGVAFYGFTALVPLLGAIVLLYGLFADAHSVIEQVRSLGSVMPRDATRLIGDQLMGIVTTSSGKKGLGLAIAILVALYGARSAAAAVVTGLNIAYEEKEGRSFLRVTLLTFTITAATVVVAIMAIFAITAVGHLQSLLPTLPGFVLLLGKLGSYLLLLLAGAAGAATLYRYGPDRAKAKWVWITPGSTIASGVWLLLTAAFGIYVADFGSYDATYGSLGAVIVFLTWLYLTSYILLLGAELNAEMERQTRVDTTEGAPLPPGERGAAVADHVLAPEERRAISDEPRSTSKPPAGDGAGRFAMLGMLRSGMASGLLATAGLSRIRRGRSPLAGFGLLAAGGLLALARRRPPAKTSEPDRWARGATGSRGVWRPALDKSDEYESKLLL